MTTLIIICSVTMLFSLCTLVLLAASKRADQDIENIVRLVEKKRLNDK